jgi:poly(beta-D-mannuronate) lyase
MIAMRLLPLLAILALATPTSAAGLNSPFPEVAPKLESDTDFSCPSKPPVVQAALSVTSIYDQSDPAHAKIDQDQFDDYNDGMSAVRDYLSTVTKYASDYVASNGKKVQSGACALVWLDSWAGHHALSDLGTRQSALSATRIVGGMGIAYLAVRSLVVPMHLDPKPLNAWFAARANDFIKTFEESGNLNSNRSNHRYWGGFAVAVSGVVTGDTDDLKWGVQSFKIGACQIRDDGALPLELNRKSRARDYHLHAIAPLVMIGELAAANGLDAYSQCGNSFQRLVHFALTEVEDPTLIVALTGSKQQTIPDRDGHPRGDRFAWVEPYFKRFGGSEADYGFTLERPLFSSNLGGRLTAYVDAVPN